MLKQASKMEPSQPVIHYSWPESKAEWITIANLRWEALKLAYAYVFTAYFVPMYVSQAEDLEGLVARDGRLHDP